MSSLEHAITLAAKARAGQVDKAGARYILHSSLYFRRIDSLEALRADGVNFIRE